MSEDITDSNDNLNLEIIESLRHIDGEADGKSSIYREDLGLSKLSAIRNTIDSLESSLKLSSGLEAEQWLHYSLLKTENTSLSDELKEAVKRNKNMINLFRRNVTDFDFQAVDEFPLNLRREVQRTWHSKYDALLKLNEQLKKEISVKDIIFEENRKQINILEERLLNLAESLIQRDEAVKSICTKYLTLKKRKDEEETLLRGSIETLQDALRKANTNVNVICSEMTLISKKKSSCGSREYASSRISSGKQRRQRVSPEYHK